MENVVAPLERGQVRPRFSSGVGASGIWRGSEILVSPFIDKPSNAANEPRGAHANPAKRTLRLTASARLACSAGTPRGYV